MLFVSEFALSTHGMYRKLRTVDIAPTLYIVTLQLLLQKKKLAILKMKNPTNNFFQFCSFLLMPFKIKKYLFFDFVLHPVFQK